MADGGLDLAGVDELYQLDPAKFVAARNELAKRLRNDGHRDSAEVVRRLKRPTVVAWALNQVARREPADIEKLLGAGAAVRDAQAAVLGGADPTRLRELTRARRAVLSALAAAATELAGAAHHAEVAATLEAATVDQEVGRALRAGRLSKEVPPPSGFGLAGLPELPDPPPRRTDQRDAERRRQELEQANEALASAVQQLRQAEARLDEAQGAVEAARVAAEAARAEQERAGTAVADLEEAGYDEIVKG